MPRHLALAITCLAACAPTSPSPLDDVRAPADTLEPADLPANVDRIVTKVLADTGVPSASVAIVKGDAIAYVHAYGDARLEPKTPATSAMRYAIGSNSKQFTAVAILLLAQDGKLSLDDTVGTYVPGLTRGDTITIRQLLTHTSGYRDYAPQDYSIPAWSKPTTPEAIVAGWAHQPLDFEPGTRWQYANTNYTIAGMIVEKVSGQGLVPFLQARVFAPLGMTSVVDVNHGTLAATDPAGYFQRASGPRHPVTPMAPGWKLGGWDLAMTAEDLARWDRAVIAWDRGEPGALLTPASAKAFGTEQLLANGAGTRYGLGVGVVMIDQHRILRHGGEDIGFVSQNEVLPDDRLAIVVLTNQDASGAAADIADRVRGYLLRASAPASLESERRVRAVLASLARGELDPALLTEDARAYFTPEAIAEYRATIAPVGPITKLEQTRTSKRGGFTYRAYEAHGATKTLSISVYETDAGALEQFLIE